MWKILLWLLGSCRVRITGGSPAWAVSRLSEARILLRDVTPIDDFTIEARILTRDAARADAACTRAMCTMEILGTSGASRTFSGLRRTAADSRHRCRIHHPEIRVFLPRQRKRPRPRRADPA